MNESESIKIAIQSVIKAMMDSVMNRVLRTDPFLADKHKAEKPLYAALVPDEVFKGSHFERRFVTSFGSVWEKLAVVAARTGLGYGVQGRLIEGKIRQERLRRITEVLNTLEHSARGKERQRPDWNTEIAYILEGEGEDIPVSVVCDVYAEDTSRKRKYAFELKSPLPNSDITKVSKEKLLKLHSMEPVQVDEAYFALPYNPYGARQNYSWSFPARWFDMMNDEVVLIGDDFWNKIGGEGTYKAFIDAVNAIGEEYKEQIYREYLGIEPPADAFDTKLQ
ncbi:MAG: TdeIII family type II restriction endonuclease [Anaerolineae bacterium]|nr:TdeIII family type II restriction endonuclease [Anaerolineae bacterium]